MEAQDMMIHYGLKAIYGIPDRHSLLTHKDDAYNTERFMSWENIYQENRLNLIQYFED